MALLPLASGASLPRPDFQRHYGVGPTNFSVQAVPTGSVTPGAAAYWLESIPKHGRAAFNPSPSEYKVFRNVKDYGATGIPSQSPPPMIYVRNGALTLRRQRSD